MKKAIVSFSHPGKENITVIGDDLRVKEEGSVIRIWDEGEGLLLLFLHLNQVVSIQFYA